MCVHARMYSCQKGFVCSDSLLEGACEKGTGGFVHCVKNPKTNPSSIAIETTQNSETTQKSQHSVASDPDASSTCTKHHVIAVLIFIAGMTL